jgi:cysteine desulfurase
LLGGGGQERRRRPGTEAPALAAGFAAAARRAREDAAGGAAGARMRALRDRLESALSARVPGARVNAAASPRLPNTSSLTFPGVNHETLVIRMDLAGFAISTGSACSTGSARPSHVLAAMGMSPEDAASTIRVSLGPSNTLEEIDSLVETLAAAVSDLAPRTAPAAGGAR